MNKLFHPLLVMIAKATSTELQQYILYLKAENQILRSKLPRRVDVTSAEREKLVKVGKALATAAARKEICVVRIESADCPSIKSVPVDLAALPPMMECVPHLLSETEEERNHNRLFGTC